MWSGFGDVDLRRSNEDVNEDDDGAGGGNVGSFVCELFWVEFKLPNGLFTIANWLAVSLDGGGSGSNELNPVGGSGNEISRSELIGGGDVKGGVESDGDFLASSSFLSLINVVVIVGDELVNELDVITFDVNEVNWLDKIFEFTIWFVETPFKTELLPIEFALVLWWTKSVGSDVCKWIWCGIDVIIGFGDVIVLNKWAVVLWNGLMFVDGETVLTSELTTLAWVMTIGFCCCNMIVPIASEFLFNSFAFEFNDAKFMFVTGISWDKIVVVGAFSLLDLLS